ncbi:hypothetical protein [Photobacterium salinisoli]|uniref:hypothetical protein n=1 Tax=Photobacterium salinisoli TaxID=1616783 RepID=UPI001F097AF1|nr:hypothetical protein [Photobacterium salinisoli]
MSLVIAAPHHERFIFELKKAAERQAVTQVFGWDEALQYQLHLTEWQECQPLLILMDGIPIGSVLLETIEPECLRLLNKTVPVHRTVISAASFFYRNGRDGGSAVRCYAQ